MNWYQVNLFLNFRLVVNKISLLDKKKNMALWLFLFKQILVRSKLLEKKEVFRYGDSLGDIQGMLMYHRSHQALTLFKTSKNSFISRLFKDKLLFLWPGFIFFRMAKLNNVLNCHHGIFFVSWYHKWGQYILKTSYSQPSHSFKGFWSKKDTACSRLQKQKLCSLFKTQDPENHILFRCTYPFRPKRWHPVVGHWGYKRFWLFWLFSLICQKARVRGVGRNFFRLSPGYSLRASSPI